MEDFSVFDIIGPRMTGPSSSHTAGAVRLSHIARKIAGEDVAEAAFTLYGSFAETGKGHGTDKALVAGALGMDPDDPRIKEAFAVAREIARGFGLEDDPDGSNLMCPMTRPDAVVPMVTPAQWRMLAR